MYCERALRALSECDPIRTEQLKEKPECFQLMRLVAILALMSFFFKKNLMITRRKYSEGGQKYRLPGSGDHQGHIALALQEVAVVEMNRVIHTDADQQGHGDNIDKIELDTCQAHDAEQRKEGETEREQGGQGQRDVPEIEDKKKEYNE